MRYISLFLLAIIINSNVFAQTQNIVAIVNDTPITLQEFKARKKLLQFVNNVAEPSPEADIHLSKTALKTLIDEQLFINEAKRFKMEISEQDITQAISVIEKNNNMPKGQFIANLRENGISVDTLKQQVKSQIIKERIAYDLSHNVGISRREIDEAATFANKGTIYVFKKVTALNSDRATNIKMASLRKKVNSCQIEQKLLTNIAEVTGVSLPENKLTGPLKTYAPKMKIGQVSDMHEENDRLVFYVLCSKDIEGMSNDQYDYVARALANKKVSVQLQKFYEKLKRKAYIKVFLK